MKRPTVARLGRASRWGRLSAGDCSGDPEVASVAVFICLGSARRDEERKIVLRRSYIFVAASASAGQPADAKPRTRGGDECGAQQERQHQEIPERGRAHAGGKVELMQTAVPPAIGTTACVEFVEQPTGHGIEIEDRRACSIGTYAQDRQRRRISADG